MENFTKVIRVGITTDGHAFAKIKYAAGKLSISGAIGPMANGDCLGSCGQWVMSFKEFYRRGHWTFSDIKPGKGWTAETVAQFLRYWNQWHLNDMQAGSPAQMAELEKHAYPGYPASYCEWAQEILRDAGLNPDPGYLHNGKPYAYGHAWLTVSVPDDVLQFLRNLPDTDILPAWV